MPFGRSKTPDRSPLRHLNEQRRKVALAGLAAGAGGRRAFPAQEGRGRGRVRRADAGHSDSPAECAHSSPRLRTAGRAQAPLPPAESGVRPCRRRPRWPIRPRPPSLDAFAERPSTSISDPATGELSAEEASILAILAQSGRIDDDRTSLAVATSLERDTAEVTTVLRKLGAEGVVSGELYTAAGDKIWAVTERGVRRLGAQS